MAGEGSQGHDGWRPVLAALANDTARTVYAEIIVSGGESATLARLAPSRRRHVIEALTSAGLIAQREGAAGFAVDPRVFANVLAAAPRPPRAEGPERFLDRDGRIVVYPADKKARAELLATIAARVFEPDVVLTEREVNERLSAVTADVAVLRRYLVDHGELERTRSGSEYARPRAV